MKKLLLSLLCTFGIASLMAMEPEDPIQVQIVALHEKRLVSLLLSPCERGPRTPIKTPLGQAREYIQNQDPATQEQLHKLLSVYIEIVWPYATAILEKRAFKAREIYETHEFLDNLVPNLASRGVSTCTALRITTTLKDLFYSYLRQHTRGQLCTAVMALSRANEPSLWHNMSETTRVFEQALIALAWLGHPCTSADRLLTHTHGICRQVGTIDNADPNHHAKKHELARSIQQTIACVNTLASLATTSDSTTDLGAHNAFQRLIALVLESFARAFDAETAIGARTFLETATEALVSCKTLPMQNTTRTQDQACALLALAERAMIRITDPATPADLAACVLPVIEHTLAMGIVWANCQETSTIYNRERALCFLECYTKALAQLTPENALYAKIQATIAAAELESHRLVIAQGAGAACDERVSATYAQLLGA